MHGLALVASIASLSLTMGAAPAGAVTVGQLPDSVPTNSCTSSNYDFLQQSVSSGNSYTVPAAGGVTVWTMTSWSHFAGPGDGQMLKMKVFRKVGEPYRYQAVVHDGPRDLAPGVINTFPTSLGVKAGDILGSNSVNAGDVFNACLFGSGLGDVHRELANQDLADGQSADFSLDDNLRLNVRAELTPTNTFTLGAITRNKKKGTARQRVTVPNPGTLRVSGKDVKAASAGARAAVTVPAAGGTVQLPIRAKGKRKRELNSTGKVKVKPTITYTPSGGTPLTRKPKVKLLKKR
jgi:hypothetical protein